MKSKPKMALGRLSFGAAAFAFAVGIATAPLHAQNTVSVPQAQSQSPSEQTLSEGQLEQLVAPIALYPDPLLTQVLMASTYPLEVVEAARWSSDNPGISGAALQTAMQAQSWDPSVKALAAVPQTLQMMSDKLDWTQQLGDAFLAQQQDVMNAVQNLRAEAQAAGNLQSNAQQTVTTQAPPAGAVVASAQPPIVIEPVNPNVYYVPVYNPAVAYGAWDYPDYPPFYWSPPGFVASNVVSFAAGVAVGAAIWGGCDWWQHNVIINVNRFNAFNRTDITSNVWTHNPAHRGDMPYRNAAVAERFGRGGAIPGRDGLRAHIDAERPAQRAPDVARDLDPRQVPMPPQRADRPTTEFRSEFERSRAEEVRPSPRTFDRGDRFDGGERRRF
jgi:hypothetical protein